MTTTLNKSVFSVEDLQSVYKQIHTNFDLSLNQSDKVIAELESHTGLFVQAGFEMFEFAHKSIQEYLTAEYIVKLPRIPYYTNIVAKLANEFAIAVTISSSPSSYFSELVLGTLINIVLPPHFFEAFVNRLMQEKPDFNTHENVDISLAVLYSLYLDESLLKRNIQNRLFYEDNLVEQIEKFVSLLYRKNTGKTILKFYRKQEQVRTINDVEVYRLEKYRGLQNYSLPQFLYVRPSFLEE